LGIVHKRVEIEDDALSDLLCVLEGVCAWVEDALGSSEAEDEQVLKKEGEEKGWERAKEPRVLVHCLQGISRSGAVVIACLMWRLDVGYEEALAMARSYRPLITANEGFAKQLQLWHQMRYSIYENEPTNAEGESQERKLKSLYLAWKAERDGLLKLGEEEVNKRRARSMASMAAQFGERRLEIKKGVDGDVRGDREGREGDSE
jgi:dual specificity phosphatase 12